MSPRRSSRAAGVLITDPWTMEPWSPLDTEGPDAWVDYASVGYKNATLRERIELVLQRLLRYDKLLPVCMPAPRREPAPIAIPLARSRVVR